MATCATRTPFSEVEQPAVGVSIKNLTKDFGSLHVLKNVSFEVQPGEIFVLMGPSGSGKSVLLKHIVGLERPTSGSVSINGVDAGDETIREQFRMALVFQAGALFNSLTVYDNLALYPREHRLGSEKEIRDKVMHALSILSLKDTEKKFPSELSGGMKKRVAIARALVTEPQLLLYDEPTSELDPVMSASIAEIIAALRKDFQVTSIVVSHDRELALNIADRIGLLMNGELIAIGEPKDFHQPKDPRIADFFAPKIDLNNPRFRKLENQASTPGA